MTIRSTINALSSVRDIDRQLAAQILHYQQQQNDDFSAEEQDHLWLAALMVSVALGKGQVCLPLTLCLIPELREHWQALAAQERAALLARSATVYVAGNAAQQTYAHEPYAQQPLVLEGHNLYLARYYFYEKSLLTQLQQRLQQAPAAHDDSALSQVLAHLFTPQAGIDWQKAAAATACTQNIAVITGGPGTGKTTTVTRLLSALLSLHPQMSIALAAPTGKAAARMTESIRNARLKADAGTLPYADKIPDESFTLHRLLGWTPRGFRYNAQQTLPFDCVVVDEASMVDLPMMHHLFNALAPSARLILLGDRDQLASVEAGSVLADLCDAGKQHGPSPQFAQRLSKLTGYDLTDYAESGQNAMQNAVAQLRVSHRFDANSGIGQLAKAVNNSDVAAAAQAFTDYSDIVFERLPAEARSAWWQDRRWSERIINGSRSFCEAVKHQGQDPQSAPEVFAAFNEFQILVALRQGIYGVQAVNQYTEHLLHSRHLLAPPENGSLWYAGRPVMISCNDYDLGLFNGDIGIALKQPQADGSSQLKVAFPAADGGVRWLLPSRLPAHETAFAMTVHKSQGSEFTELCLLLPDQWQTVITRELIYTAITRARARFCLFATDSCWNQGLVSRVQRASGLRDALWGTSSIVGVRS